ncbi:MAG: fibrobacter succinogenes major paralogous domain-containing protein [Candidatus Peribacteria bacterium]|nr:fibrobacter succinogenes major paralogous domain-containing protein [Candidatus Peribacteria bacterium]
MGERNQLLIARANNNNVTLSDSSGYKYFSSNTTAAQKFMNDLKLPLAGSRYYDSASSISNQGSDGGYWSSSPSSTNARSLSLSWSRVYAYSNYRRAYGFSVRCFKN